MEFEDRERESTALIITGGVLERMEQEATKAALYVDKEMSYARRQQLLTIMSLVNVLETQYNIILPIEISKELLK